MENFPSITILQAKSANQKKIHNNPIARLTRVFLCLKFMIDLTFYTNKILSNAPNIAQVIQPERVTTTALDTSALLAGLLEPHVGTRVYPYKLPDDVQYPSITYEQSGADRHEVDGYIITKTDTFIVSIQAETLSDIISVADAVKASLIAYAATDAAGGIEITDYAITYQNELQRYEAAMEVQITHLPLASQATPAYYIYPIAEKAQKNESINCVSQLVDEHFVGLLVAQIPASGVSGISHLRREVFNQIINQIPEPKAGRTEFLQGSVAGLVGSVVIWRDVFNVNTMQSIS